MSNNEHLSEEEMKRLNGKISEQNEKISEQNGEISQFISLHEHLMEEISEERMKLEKKEEELEELNKLFAQRGR
jgi:predicted  nucleic acid-binding Zn-ribbon protein